MNVSQTIKSLVTMLAGELANINDRKRQDYFNAVLFNRRERARMDSGEIEERELADPEPPMLFVVAQTETLENSLVEPFTEILKAAENYDERREGIENFPGLSVFRLDPENPNKGIVGVPNRSVISGNEARPGTPAAYPADTPPSVPLMTDQTRAVLAEQEQQEIQKSQEKSQQKADAAAASTQAAADAKAADKQKTAATTTATKPATKKA